MKDFRGKIKFTFDISTGLSRDTTMPNNFSQRYFY